MRLKRIFSEDTFMRAKAEHDDLSVIANQLERVVRPAVLKAQWKRQRELLSPAMYSRSISTAGQK